MQELLTIGQVVPDEARVRAHIAALCTRYPFLESVPIGRSACGREISGLLLGTGAHTVLYTAAIHGQEWLTSLLLLRLCADICRSVESGKTLRGIALWRAMHGRSLLFVPVANPDGVEIALHGAKTAGAYAAQVELLGGNIHGRWQANARGVDLNHNFNAGFAKLQELERKNGICAPCARQYGGVAPESEPETQALTALCERVQPAHLVALHSQGEVIYWQYGYRTPERARLMAEILATSCGYALEQPDALASHGGMKDWFIERFARPAFTVECGRGCNPLPLSDFPDLYEKLAEMLLLAAIL